MVGSRDEPMRQILANLWVDSALIFGEMSVGVLAVRCIAWGEAIVENRSLISQSVEGSYSCIYPHTDTYALCLVVRDKQPPGPLAQRSSHSLCSMPVLVSSVQRSGAGKWKHGSASRERELFNCVLYTRRRRPVLLHDVGVRDSAVPWRNPWLQIVCKVCPRLSRLACALST